MISSAKIVGVISQLSANPIAQHGMRAIVSMLFAVIVFRQLHSIGWSEILSHLPRSPGFYAFFVIIYVAGPAADVAIYHEVWKTRPLTLLPVMLRKRMLNESVLGYSGEAYLALQARHLTAAPSEKLFYDVRDCNLVSSFVSTIATLVLAAPVLLWAYGLPNSHRILIGSIAIAVIAALILLGRHSSRNVLQLRGRTLRFVLAAYSTRLVVILALQILLWKIGVPQAPIAALVVILAALQVATRIPFAPSYDVLLLGVGVTLASSLNLPAEAMTGLLVASVAITQTLNLIVWWITPGISQGTRIKAPATLHSSSQ